MRILTFLFLSVILACTASKLVKKTDSASSSTTSSSGVIRVDQADVAKDINYLASDELGGRGTGSAGIEMAATYISEVFAEAKIGHVQGKNRYDQAVPLAEQAPPASVDFQVADKSYVLEKDLLAINQVEINTSAPLRFLGESSLEEIASMDLKDAIVVTIAGSKELSNPIAFYQLAKEKQKIVAAAGGLALIELYRSPQAPFSQVYRFLGGSGLKIDSDQKVIIPLLWLNDPKGSNLQLMDEAAGTAVKLSLKPGSRKKIPASNLIGYIPGTDPTLRNEIVLIGAHYDHLGIDGSRGGADSIFNGARDNALGTAALLAVARHFGANPGKRPMLLAAWTAEEKGLLGSEYYAQQPLIPLKQYVFNLNFDGAGYDDTTSVTMNGYGRTTLQEQLDYAIADVGILPNPDPVPEMGLYQQSDNWSFATRGIPAINLAPGFTGFSPELMKYYHQANDQSEDLDFVYVTRYVRAAVAAAQAVVNAAERPSWVADDELIPVSKRLYGQ